MRLFFIIFLICLNTYGQNGYNTPLKAFPSAYGGGSSATGGRNGALCIITTLDETVGLTYHAASGGDDEYYTGGLYAALQNADVGPIVFNLSGPIDLGVGGTGGTYGFDGIPNVNNKTIYGQSAPLGGITLTGGTFRITGRYGDGNNLIIRYIRSRPIYARFGAKDNIGGTADDDSYTWAFLFYGGDDIMLSNCSASFAYDKAVGMYIDRHVAAQGNGGGNLTVQNCLLADSSTMVAFGVNPNQDGDPEDLIDYISFYNNAVIGGNRTPNMSWNGQADVINNVVYDPITKMMNTFYGLNLNHINNWFATPATTATKSHAHQELGLGVYPVIYTDGNYYEGFNYYPNVNSDNTDIWVEFNDRTTQLASSFFTSSQHSLSGIPNKLPPISAAATYTELITNRNVGANKYLDNDGYVQTYQDPFDEDMLEVVENRTDKSWKQVSEWVLPTTPTNTRPGSYDTDNDGMADAWEIREYGDLNESYRGDFDGDGYTNLEEYMNQVDDATGSPPPSASESRLKVRFFNKKKRFF